MYYHLINKKKEEIVRGKGHGFRRRFMEFGYKFTSPRQIILDIVLASNKHLSAEEIFFKAKEIYPGIGIATVYRTLEILHEMGIIEKHDFGHKKVMYEKSRGESHSHIICKKCGKVVNVSFDDVECKETLNKMKENILKKYDFKIEAFKIQFFGICKECDSKK
jgi:Fur family ferric uptake transcriptional regulator